MKKDLIYAFTCLVFAIIIGGAVYEHLCVIPKWSAAPPVSLSMFQGEYGMKPDIFWMLVHPTALTLFVISTVMHRKTARKKFITRPFIGYILVLVTTALYFVPELIAITTTPFAEVADAGLTKRATLWEILSLVRLAFLIGLAITLFLGLAKSGAKLGQRETKTREYALAQPALG